MNALLPETQRCDWCHEWAAIADVTAPPRPPAPLYYCQHHYDLAQARAARKAAS